MVAKLASSALDQVDQTRRDTMAAGGRVNVELLQLGHAIARGNLAQAGSADDPSPLVMGNEVRTPTNNVELAHVIELRIEVGGSGQREARIPQARAHKRGHGNVIGGSDSLDRHKHGDAPPSQRLAPRSLS